MPPATFCGDTDCKITTCGATDCKITRCGPTSECEASLCALGSECQAVSGCNRNSTCMNNSECVGDSGCEFGGSCAEGSHCIEITHCGSTSAKVSRQPPSMLDLPALRAALRTALDQAAAEPSAAARR